MTNNYVQLARNTNQARGIGQYAIDFLAGRLGQPDPEVLERVELLHLDSVACAIAALGAKTNAPLIFRDEAMDYLDPCGATMFGSWHKVSPEKAVLANTSATRELDANGTNFGYNPRTGYIRGEFGHNDFYPVAVAATQVYFQNGRQTLLAMLCLDEIRGRLAECYGLKDHKIDHVLHGGIASAAVYGAVAGATAEQIESAIGLTVAHYVPFRAIRHGEQLSDSKGASAALTAEVAVQSMRRVKQGFVGPADIFRNPQAIFCLFEPPAEQGASPFDLELACGGGDFAVMGMHFKLGLYEHQSAGAIGGLLDLLTRQPALITSPGAIAKIRITIYQPAFSIIGDPHKRDPRTRQSADHSLVYIIGTLLRKACEQGWLGDNVQAVDLWRNLMLMPADYDAPALAHPLTRQLMDRIEFVHGGPDYDAQFPNGIPTTVEIEHQTLGHFSSGLVMYPEGHARNISGNLSALLRHKFTRLTALGCDDPAAVAARFTSLASKTAHEISDLHDFELKQDVEEE